MRALVIGGVSYDYILQIGDISRLQPDLSYWANNAFHMLGSTGAGKALTLDGLGIDVSLITAIGNDNAGDKIKEALSKTTIDTHFLIQNETTTHVNIMHSNGNRITVADHFPTNDPIIELETYRHLFESVDIIFLNINPFCKQFFPLMEEVDIPIVLDLHDYDGVSEYHKDFIPYADYCFTSGVSITNQEKYIQDQIKAGMTLSVVTNGERGSIGQDQSDEVKWYNAFESIEYIDSNGAGDAYSVGCSIVYLLTNNLEEALHFGTECGAASCESYTLFEPNKELTIKLSHIIQKKS